jgi:hypothetical protein
LVDEHIKDCGVCKEVLEKLNINNNIPNFNVDNIEINALKKIKKRILKKFIIVTLSTAICTAILFWVAFTWQITIPFNIDNIEIHPSYSISLINWEIFSSTALYIRNDYLNIYFMHIDGVLYYQTTQTIYSRIFGQGGSTNIGIYSDDDPQTISNDRSLFSIGSTQTGFISFLQNNDILRYVIGDDINRIYYMRGNYNRLLSNETALERARENAVLVWER